MADFLNDYLPQSKASCISDSLCSERRSGAEDDSIRNVPVATVNGRDCFHPHRSAGTLQQGRPSSCSWPVELEATARAASSAEM